ncbi:penicillin acylase family protein [Ectobacillus sp. JY-23]|uniref:penicillin acylase family protein n=1 Tax=Ectobacillus sp. JY-23 TaxID=2933872 RepID=UPI001FF55BC7|nr:penicillin acylase family protein [Ectobacillus sp. JY-23]UOY91968.1 penicillin acylase family protein [Ectobacillus sp. JY-23]
MEQLLVEKRVKTRRWKRLLAITLVFLISIAGVAYTAGTLYIKRSLPQVSGVIAIDGLQGQVRIIRDATGVPHIKANSLQDLYMAQGYITAQDRLFQMDLSRRQASGRLSEVIGEATIERDKFFRTFGLRRAAELSYDSYSKEAKDVLKWYANGVNAFIMGAKKKNRLPIEFTLLRYEPELWTPIDSLAIGKYMAFDLGGHWQGQAFRYHLLKTVSTEKALELFPAYPDDAPAIISAIEETSLDISNRFVQAVIPNPFNGSNNWVVSGSKTKSGKPMLADDPHLSLGTPAIWYQTKLSGPGVNVSGVIFAGIPGIILGHNDFIAWGVTNVGPDVQDLYMEKRNPVNDKEFLFNNVWEPAKVIKEPIAVKGKEPIAFEVLETRHGPIISDFAHDQDKETALALKWTALEPSTELEAVLRMNVAKDWESFKDALTYFHTPAQNFVFASKDGTIAYRANGKIPIRKQGDGSLPVPGWTDEYEWTGFIPWDDLPTIVNPTEGFIATANNKVIHQYSYHITNSWAQPYREMRIKEVLYEKNNITPQDMMELQMDQINLQAREFVPVFLSKLEGIQLSEKQREALAVLKKWNYKDDRNLSAPLIFNLWMKEISVVLFEKDISSNVIKLFEDKAQVTDTLIRKAAAGERSLWIEEMGGLQEVLSTSLQRTLTKIEKQQGKNMKNWTWGTFHRVAFSHPLSSVGPLSYIFNSQSPIPLSGSRVTVQAAGWDEETGIVNHGAPWRFVIDTSNMDKGYHIVGPGQSGHVKSEWYQNQLENWVNGVYHVTTLKQPSGKELTLVPIIKKQMNKN